MQDLKNKVRAHVFSQIENDAIALSELAPAIGWRQRVEQAADDFLPQLIAFAPALMQEVAAILNSPNRIRESWQTIRRSLVGTIASEEIQQAVRTLDDELRHESNLLTVITGETVSGLLTDFLCRGIATLRKNKRSTYPDLYFAGFDYSRLPQRRRGQAIGPARKGDAPSSVPDGIEIKSQRGQRIRVDCHHPHQGLHLVMTFDQQQEDWVVFDVLVAYLTKADYRRATRNTTATTEKFSFSHAPFISVITGIAAGDGT